MKNLFTLFLLSFHFIAGAQVICGTADENGMVTLTVPPDNVITSIEFASYGTPNGTCGSFTLGSCHAANSLSIVEAAFVGQVSASINASNGVFGDPCGGTVKRLYIQAIYSSTLPLTLVSFVAQKTGATTVRLEWTSENEVNTSHFEIEKSTDGAGFTKEGVVKALGHGSQRYNFTSQVVNTNPVYYYRLRMVDIDGNFQYSVVTRIQNNEQQLRLAVFPNPADQTITISSDEKQEGQLLNNHGQLLKKLNLVKGTQTVDIGEWPAGVYLLRAGGKIVKFIKR